MYCNMCAKLFTWQFKPQATWHVRKHGLDLGVTIVYVVEKLEI